MIKTIDLTVSYGEENILEDINVEIKEKERTIILGPNGTGKSTFLNTIVGRLAPRKGQVYYGETPVQEIPKRELARKVSYIPQMHNSVFDFKVIDVVLMGRTPHMSYFSTPRKEDYLIAETYMEEMGIYHLRNKYYTEISGGERQTVLITSALCQEAETIILDEPTSHLDFGKSYLFIEKMDKLNKERNIGVIMTTHFPDHALQLGGNCILIKDQSIFAEGKVEEVLTEEKLSEVYGVEIKKGKIFNKNICVITA